MFVSQEFVKTLHGETGTNKIYLLLFVSTYVVISWFKIST